MISHPRSTRRTERAALAMIATVACVFGAACREDRAIAPAAPLAASMAKGGSGGSGGTGGLAIAVIDLGTGDNGTAEAVNDKGQIVGTGGAGVGAFLWENGVIRPLGTLPGMTGSHAEDINESGQVVGYSNDGAGLSRAFIWTAATGIQPLGGSLGGCCSWAYAINDAGLVAGYAALAGSGAHAVVWENGVMRDIQSFPTGGTIPWDLSNTGIAVGQWNPAGGFMWTAAGGMKVLAGLDGEGDVPIGVNDQGQVVGWYRRTPTDPAKAFLWTNGVITDLGTFGGTGSVGTAINNAGQVVGRAERPRKGTQTVHRAFLWTAAAGMQDLGSLSGREWAQALDLNETGWVVGQTWLGSGQSRATLWKLK